MAGLTYASHDGAEFTQATSSLAVQFPGLTAAFRVKNTFARGEWAAYYASVDVSQIWVFKGTFGAAANGTRLANSAKYKVAGVATTAIAITAEGQFCVEGACSVNLTAGAAVHAAGALRPSQTVAGQAVMVTNTGTVTQGKVFGWGAHDGTFNGNTITAWIRSNR